MSAIPTTPFSKTHEWNPQGEPLTSYPGYPHFPLDPSAVSSFLESEVSISRLNNIYRHLWIAGRKSHIRPLHKQLMLRRKILVTEDPSMHLIWFENTIFLKPIPEALLCWQFWERFICIEPNNDDNDDGGEGQGRQQQQPQQQRTRGPLYETACGFLLSYTRLINHPSDYRIAVEHHLIPDMGFQAWCLLARDLKASRPNFVAEKRWEYGELRLSRLNWVYKLTLRGYSYFYVYTEYSPYFGKNFQLLVLGFAYCSVVLAAMQVIMALKDPAGWLVDWCYRFSVVVILFVFVVVCAILGLFCGLFWYHLVLSLVHQRKFKGKTHIA